ncbi:MAG: hypothetical protein FWD71_11910 [Oscillospiraceae bacterium]|nr:hypothetical protein [Oscillospiraceae bacterium]
MTLDIYSHAIKAKDKETADKLNSLYANSKDGNKNDSSKSAKFILPYDFRSTQIVPNSAFLPLI